MIFTERDKYKENVGIYAIENLINNKVYIGQTLQNFQRRFWHHNWKLKDNSHDNIYLQAAWNKYGEDNFIFKVIEICDDTNIDEREIFWISYFKDKNLSYNMLFGGNGRRGHPMSENAKRIVGEKNRKHNIGKKASQETKDKMSKTHKGKRVYRKNDRLTDDEAVLIKQRLIDGNVPMEISKELGIPYNVINNINNNISYKTVYVEGWDDYYNNRDIRLRSPKFTDIEINRILELHNQGLNNVEIAKIFNTSKSRIRQCILKNKIC